jgi:adenylate cyclase
MNFRDRPRSIWAFPLIALAVVLTLLGSDWHGFASGLRGALFDAYQRQSPRPYEDTHLAGGFSVRVLDIDRQSIARFGAWPWPHATLAKLVAELKEEGAKLVVLDLALDRADPASPANLIAEIPPGPAFDGTRAALEQMPSPDSALAESFAHVATVAGFTLGDLAGNPVSPKASIAYAGSDYPFDLVEEFPFAAGPIGPAAKESAGLGARNLTPDRDGMLRRMTLVFRLNGKPVASLDAEALRVAQNMPALRFRAGEGGDIFSGPSGIAALETPGGDIPAGPDGSLWIAYARESGARDISAASIDRHSAGPGRLQNAIVYIGSPDETVSTPFGARTTAQVHAETLENILLNAALRRPAAAINAELAALLLSGLVTIFLLVRFGMRWAGVFAFFAIAGFGAASWQLFAANRVLLDPAGPGLGIALTFAAGAVARILEVGGARARLHDAFADALSADAIARIARKPVLMRLEGENRNVTYLVCGVRGFAALAASFRDDPVSFNRLLQRVFGPLMDEVLAHRGTIERITGEGFSAFWNAPLDDPEHAIHACEAASGMMTVIAHINEVVTLERRIDGAALAPVEIGIGISTGPAIAGGFRTHGRTTYSAVGECAITAARIQQLSGNYGPAVIVSEDTRKSAERGFAFLEVDYVAVTADTNPTKLYAMLGNPVMRASPKFRALTTFHDHIFQSLRSQQWDKARELIDQCRKLSGASQKLYDLHLARIAWFENHPPGSDWDGVFRPILK